MLFTINEAASPIIFRAARYKNPRLDHHLYPGTVFDFDIKIVRSFDEFCSHVSSPKEAMISFIMNGVGYEAAVKKRTMYWPEILMSKKEGNCFDFGVFMHFFFQKKGIEHALGFSLNLGRSSALPIPGHCFPVFRSPIDGNLWIWNYFAPKQGDINGPFETYEEIADEAGSYFSILYNSENYAGPIASHPREARIPLTTIVREEELQIIDQAYSIKDVRLQDEISGSLPSVQRMQMQFMDYRDALLKGSPLRRVVELFWPNPAERSIQSMFREFFKNGK